MTKIISRQYLEIKSVEDLVEVLLDNKKYSLNLVSPNDFQLNKFFYKQIGKKYEWKDRLGWEDKNWINYVSTKNVSTFVLKKDKDVIGYFELIFHEENREIEIAYLGILEEYFGKKLGGFLLGEAIKKSFQNKIKRVWVHTCSLDHENALKNYLSRGMIVFKSETLKR
jgi:ribosomal protein S18 acetylase RimI-like enzyme